MLKKYFRQLHLELDPFEADRPVLLIANHFSWWDGFIGNYLSFKHFHKKFHVMMLREQLEKRMFLNKGGAYSIEKSSRSILESLEYTAELLSSPENMAMMFPQGHFESLYHREFHFEPGIGRILEQCGYTPQIVFNINLIDYFSKPGPTLFIRTRSYHGEPELKRIQEEFNRFHMVCIHNQDEKLV